MVLWMGQKSGRNNLVGGHINEVTLTLSPPRVSLWRVKSSGIRQSKIYKWPLVVKGLRHGSNVHVIYDI